MSNFIPMVSSSPPPLDDGGGFDDWDEDFGNFMGADENVSIGNGPTNYWNNNAEESSKNIPQFADFDNAVKSDAQNNVPDSSKLDKISNIASDTLHLDLAHNGLNDGTLSNSDSGSFPDVERIYEGGESETYKTVNESKTNGIINQSSTVDSGLCSTDFSPVPMSEELSESDASVTKSQEYDDNDDDFDDFQSNVAISDSQSNSKERVTSPIEVLNSHSISESKDSEKLSSEAAVIGQNSNPSLHSAVNSVQSEKSDSVESSQVLETEASENTPQTLKENLVCDNDTSGGACDNYDHSARVEQNLNEVAESEKFTFSCDSRDSVMEKSKEEEGVSENVKEYDNDRTNVLTAEEDVKKSSVTLSSDDVECDRNISRDDSAPADSGDHDSQDDLVENTESDGNKGLTVKSDGSQEDEFNDFADFSSAPPDFQERNSLQETISESEDNIKSENMSDVKVITPPEDPSHKSQTSDVTSDNEFDEFAEVESHNTSKDSQDVDEINKDEHGGQKAGENVVKENDIEDFSPKTILDSQQKPTCDISDVNQSIEVQDEPTSDNSGEDNFEAFQNAPSDDGSGDDFAAFQDVQSDNSRTENFAAFQEAPTGVNSGGDKFDAFQDTPSGGDSGGDNWAAFGEPVIGDQLPADDDDDFDDFDDFPDVTPSVVSSVNSKVSHKCHATQRVANSSDFEGAIQF